MKWNSNTQILAFEVMSFYDWLETNHLGTSGICLWFALLQTWHKAGCPEEFAVARSVLEVKTGLKKDALSDARNALQKAGLIKWRKRSGRQAALYYVVSLYQTQTTPQSFSVGITDTTTLTTSHANPAQLPPQPPTIISRSSSYINTQESSNIPTPINNGAEIPTQPPAQAPCVGITDTTTLTTSHANPAQAPCVGITDTTTLTTNHANPAQAPCVGITDTTPYTTNHAKTIQVIQQVENSPHNPFKHYEQLFGFLRTMAIEEIKDFLVQGLEERLICLAMDRSHENGACHWNYAKKILDRCVVGKVHTVKEFLKKEEQYRIKMANKKAGKGGINAGNNASPPPNGEDNPYKNIPTGKL